MLYNNFQWQIIVSWKLNENIWKGFSECDRLGTDFVSFDKAQTVSELSVWDTLYIFLR